jgi:DNA repair exonuclease SbcCD ATPase subunit
MSELQLNGIVMRNWAKFESAHVQFPEYGLVVVSGVNRASNGKLMSVGSGKTAFGEALGRCMFGVRTRFGNLKDASRDQKGNTYVKVSATYHGKPLIIEAGYRCKEISTTGEGLRFSYDGKQVERGKITQTRDDLDALLGMTADLAAWTVFVDGQHMNFHALAQNDSVNLVMSALKQPPWNMYHENAKKTYQQCRRDVATEQGKHDSAQNAVVQAQESVYSANEAVSAAKAVYEKQIREHKARISQKQETLKAHQTAIDTATARKTAIEREMKKLEESAAERQHALEIELNSVRDTIREAESARQALVDAKEKASSAYALADQAYRTMANRPAQCPTCQRPMDDAANPEDLAKAKAARDTAFRKHTSAQQAYREHEDNLVALREDEQKKVKALRDNGSAHAVNKLNEEYRGLERTIRAAADAIHRTQLEIAQAGPGANDEALRKAEAVLEERRRAQEEAETKLAEAAHAVIEAKQAQDLVGYWCTAFSPTGIPNKVLEDSLGPLNQEARRISALMTGGTLRVQFSTQRILVEGEARPKLNVVVDNALGSADARLNSKGEGGLTNFIIAETLGEVGQVANRVGFRYYDEIVPHQDAVVCQSLYSYLRNVAQERKILIFIVDHNPAVNNYAEYFLQVEKSGEGEDCKSTIAWL